MRDEADRRIGHLYPKPFSRTGSRATVIAWLWARTVTCPNPACRVDDATCSQLLAEQEERQRSLGSPCSRLLLAKQGSLRDRGTARRSTGQKDHRPTGATCLLCRIRQYLSDYVRTEGEGRRMGAQLMALSCRGTAARYTFAPTEEHEQMQRRFASPSIYPRTNLPERALGFRVQAYGMTHPRRSTSQIGSSRPCVRSAISSRKHATECSSRVERRRDIRRRHCDVPWRSQLQHRLTTSRRLPRGGTNHRARLTRAFSRRRFR